MPRLIDADKIADFVCSVCGDICDDEFKNRGCIERQFIEECAKKMPTVDAIPVVRCKECKFAHMTYGGECKYCDVWEEEGEMYLDGDFYCAFGERREDGDN